MSPIAVVLLAAAIAIVAACEWPRLRARVGVPKRPARAAKRRSKANLRVVSSDHEEFARSVERDLAALPTIDEQDAKRR
jgi:outer membrane lipopolysaccharide assembly protein LptE/RlpB